MRPVNQPRVVQQLPDGGPTIIKTSAVKGMRQLRCPKCHSMAGPVTDHQGNNVIQCSSCGMKYQTKRM